MPTTDYVTLTTSTSSLSKRFKIVQSGLNKVLEKTGDARRTIGGSLDVSMGSSYRIQEWIIMLRQEEPDPDYGDYDDLETFFLLNNPNGSPSNKITLVDHFGVTHYVYLMGTLQESLLTASIQGQNAWYTMRLTVVFIP